MTTRKTGTAFPVGRHQRLWAMLSMAAILLMTASTPSSALAEDAEILLKPDVPKMDTPIQPKRQTLKGSVEHQVKGAGAPKKNPLAGKLNSSGQQGVLAGPGVGALDRKKPLSGKTGTQNLSGATLAGIGIIGVKFMMTFGQPPIINKVFPGTPAFIEGVRPNDVIVAVDGVPTYGLTKEEVYDLIVGTPNTQVTLSLQRGGDFTVRKMHRMDFNDIPDPNVKRDYMYSM